jgi:hypothetical protein
MQLFSSIHCNILCRHPLKLCGYCPYVRTHHMCTRTTISACGHVHTHTHTHTLSHTHTHTHTRTHTHTHTHTHARTRTHARTHTHAHRYDIPKSVAQFNQMPQFTTSVNGGQGRLHFVHKRCADPGATPILLAHGWPGSVLEFHKMIEPLARDFHVVAPSIPGYAWSDPPEHRGHTYVRSCVSPA